jgi:hypothetical protein
VEEYLVADWSHSGPGQAEVAVVGDDDEAGAGGRSRQRLDWVKAGLSDVDWDVRVPVGPGGGDLFDLVTGASPT